MRSGHVSECGEEGGVVVVLLPMRKREVRSGGGRPEDRFGWNMKKGLVSFSVEAILADDREKYQERNPISGAGERQRPVSVLLFDI